MTTAGRSAFEWRYGPLHKKKQMRNEDNDR
jgi:hypothetical protein